MGVIEERKKCAHLLGQDFAVAEVRVPRRHAYLFL